MMCGRYLLLKKKEVCVELEIINATDMDSAGMINVCVILSIVGSTVERSSPVLSALKESVRGMDSAPASLVGEVLLVIMKCLVHINAIIGGNVSHLTFVCVIKDGEGLSVLNVRTMKTPKIYRALALDMASAEPCFLVSKASIM
jgi:hypothetical protein